MSDVMLCDLCSKNELTGEHSCIMIKPVVGENATEDQHNWLNQFHDGQTACYVYTYS